jgi:hypothetical protein
MNTGYLVESENETWASIKNYEGFYKVSNYTTIISLARNGHPDRLITPTLSPIGYYIVGLSKNNESNSFYLHRILATTFLQNPDDLPCVNHKDGNKLNNTLMNLEWCTFKRNSQHAIENGLMKMSGEDNHSAILKEYEVLEIFYSSLKTNELTRLYNVAPVTISQIRTGRNWSFLTGKKHTPKYSHLTTEIILEIFSYEGSIKDTMARFNIGSSTVKLIRSGRGHSEITGKKYIPQR